MMFSCGEDILTNEEKAEMLDLARFFRHMGFDVQFDDREFTLSYEPTHAHFTFNFCNDVNRMREFVLDAYDFFLEKSETATYEELKEKGLSSMDWIANRCPLPLLKSSDEEIGSSSHYVFGTRRLISQDSLEREQAFVAAIRERFENE